MRMRMLMRVRVRVRIVCDIFRKACACACVYSMRVRVRVLFGYPIGQFPLLCSRRKLFCFVHIAFIGLPPKVFSQLSIFELTLEYGYLVTSGDEIKKVFFLTAGTT